MPEGNVQLDRSPYEHTCMLNKTTTGSGEALNVSEYKAVVVAIASASNYNGTVKCQGTIMQIKPDWDSSSSATNIWENLRMTRLMNSASIKGTDGVSASGSDFVTIYEIDTNGITYVNFDQTARSAGNVSVYIRPYKNS